MKRNQIHERATFAREASQLDRVLFGVVHAAEHHVLERHAAVEDLGGFDHLRERKLGVDRHQLAAQRVARRMDRDRETELLRTLAERDDPGRTPTVEIVMCRAPMPSAVGSFRIVSAASTAFQFMSGSPMPMNTTFVT